jgi:hypothetical protein
MMIASIRVLGAPFRVVGGFVGWIHAAICALTTAEGRKGWAMLAALGCCVVMTAEVAVVLWLVRTNAMLAFWIGMSAQGVNFVVVTGLMVLLGVKRSTKLSVPIPGGGTASLGIDDEGQPVVVTSTPVAPALPPPPAPGAPLEPGPAFPPHPSRSWSKLMLAMLARRLALAASQRADARRARAIEPPPSSASMPAEARPAAFSLAAALSKRC